MQLLTNSKRACFQRCRREHFYSYELGRRPRKSSDALGFGSLFHVGLEAWWNFGRESTATEERLIEAFAAVEGAFGNVAEEADLDFYDRVRVEELLRGYHFRWMPMMREFTVLGVETTFVAPLVNPATGKPSRNWELGGKLDAIVNWNGEVWIVEHKTTSSDIGPASDYWMRLRIDGQVSTYYEGARALGYDVKGCIYDVARKPQHKPYRATPPENRKYKKDGTLYANQRTDDENPADYRDRISASIAEEPDRYYQRTEIIRLDDDMREFQADAWMTAKAMRECQLQDAHPRNPDACVRYGKFCPYFDVCTGMGSIDDDSRFRQSRAVHEELPPGEEGGFDA